jgi:hypothetical protein
MNALGLPLHQLDGDYFASEEIAGCNHFGVWPLTQAAQACFGSPAWPGNVAIPQVSVEFELADAAAVSEGARELRSQGYDLLHEAKTEPWGQVVARLLSPEGAVVGCPSRRLCTTSRPDGAGVGGVDHWLRRASR